MANPSSFPTFSGLSASEVAAMQSGAPEQRPEVMAAPLACNPSSEVLLHRARTRVPTVVRPAPSTAPRGKVARTPTTFVDPTTAGISQGLRSVILREDDLPPPVFAHPGHERPLGSFFDSFLDTLGEEQGRNLCSKCGPEQPRLPPPPQTRHPRPSQQPIFLRPPQQPRLPGPPQPYRPQQQAYRYPQRPLVFPYSSSQSRDNFLRRINRPYPFKREAVRKIFKLLLKRQDFQLPVPIRPDQVGRDSHPNYCPYHQTLGHVLEDCVAFKEWLERGLEEGSVMIPDEYLADSPLGPTKVIFDLTDPADD